MPKRSKMTRWPTAESEANFRFCVMISGCKNQQLNPLIGIFVLVKYKNCGGEKKLKKKKKDSGLVWIIKRKYVKLKNLMCSVLCSWVLSSDWYVGSSSILIFAGHFAVMWRCGSVPRTCAAAKGIKATPCLSCLLLFSLIRMLRGSTERWFPFIGFIFSGQHRWVPHSQNAADFKQYQSFTF